MKPEEIELLKVLCKYPQLIQENPELFIFVYKKIQAFGEGLCNVLQPVFELLAVVMKPFIDLFNGQLEEKKDGNANSNH